MQTIELRTGLRDSYQAFLRDLPDLLAEYSGQWVAYSGETRLGINSSRRSLYRDCVAAGHCDREFLIAASSRHSRLGLMKFAMSRCKAPIPTWHV